MVYLVLLGEYVNIIIAGIRCVRLVFKDIGSDTFTSTSAAVLTCINLLILIPLKFIIRIFAILCGCQILIIIIISVNININVGSSKSRDVFVG